MSADNYLLIHKKTFEVFNGCASNQNIWLVGKGKDLEDAIEIAEKYEKSIGYVEYGIKFVTNLKGLDLVKKEK